MSLSNRGNFDPKKIAFPLREHKALKAGTGESAAAAFTGRSFAIRSTKHDKN